MSDVKKQWKEREELSIGELEDIWFANRNFEMARSIILAVKDFQKITLEEKLEFLQSVLYEQNNLSRESEFQYICNPLLETFLFLLPEWKQESSDRNGRPYARLILVLLSKKDFYSYINISAGQVKKFVHSYLNNVRKEDMKEYPIIDVLINNRMFKELVNYNFVSDETIKTLWDFLFTKPGNYADEYLKIINLDHFLNVRREPNSDRMKELLCSWDKIENRHALSTLWTLLAKKGELQKIFGVEKTEEIKKTE